MSYFGFDAGSNGHWAPTHHLLLADSFMR